MQQIPWNRVLVPLIALMVSLLATPATFGQDAPQWVQITTLKVKPERVQEFLDAVRNELIPAQKAGGVTFRNGWRTVYGEANTFRFVTQLDGGLASLDNPGPLSEMEAGARANMITKLRSGLDYRVVTAAILRQDLSSMPEGAPKVAVISTVDVAPGKADEYAAFIRDDLLPAIKKSDVTGFVVLQQVFGAASSNSFEQVFMFEDFTHLGKGNPVQRALGPEAARTLFEKTEGIAAHGRLTVMRYDPSLSIAVEN